MRGERKTTGGTSEEEKRVEFIVRINVLMMESTKESGEEEERIKWKHGRKETNKKEANERKLEA